MNVNVKIKHVNKDNKMKYLYEDTDENTDENDRYC